MADLDDDILALAGDVSEDDAEERKSEGGPAWGGASSSNEAVEKTVKPRSKGKKAPRKRVARRRGSDDDGEVSSLSQDDSAPMEESEDDVFSPSGDKSGTLFPVDNRFYSEKDKAEIMAKPEVEREEILAERAALAERRQQDSSLLRLFDKRAEGDMGARKRQADAAGLEGGERKSTRQRKNLGGRKVGEQSAAIATLKEQRANLRERKATAADGSRRRRSVSGSDLDAEGESEVEWDDSRARPNSKAQYEEPADLADFNRLHVGRLQFAKYCYYPTFEKAVKDCYVRVAISGDKSSDGPSYRMCKIEGIKQDGEPYAMEGENGRTMRCQKYAIASIGKARREWPFIYCSSSRPSEREFAKYKTSLMQEEVPLPKKSFLVAKIQDINDLINYRFTEQELAQKLANSGVLEERQKKREIVILTGKRNDAERDGNKDLVRQIDDEIRQLAGPSKLAHNTSLTKAAPLKTVKSEGERLAEINRQNRKANTESVRRAELAELKAAQEQRVKIERGEAVADPFARVKIRPKTHFDANAAANAGGGSKHLTEAEIARRIAEEQAKEDAESARRAALPNGLAKLVSGDTEVQPGRIDFAKYDLMFQFGKLSQKKRPGQASIFRRKLFDHEVLGTYDLGVKVDMDW